MLKYKYSDNARLNSGIVGISYKWESGIMPYKFDSNVEKWQRNKVRKATHNFNQELLNCLAIR